MTGLPSQIIAFAGNRCLGLGAPSDVAAQIKAATDDGGDAPLLIFDAATSRSVEIDLRGTLADVQTRLATHAPTQSSDAATDVSTPRGPGRPKLGVIAREITLLPRHSDWLAQQPGGASVALRKLVEDARRASSAKDRAREAQESLHRFMTAMAGDYPLYEDALRALYANDRTSFDTSIAKWSTDVRNHIKRLADNAFFAT